MPKNEAIMRAQALATWKDDYNMVRPHSGLGNLTPAAYADGGVPGTQRGAALRRGLRAPSRCFAEPPRSKSD